MPVDPELYAEMVARHAAADREARADTRRAFVLFALEVLVATAVALVLMGMAIHTTDEALGRIYWYGGEAAWLAGLAIAIHRARRRAGDRGDLGPPV
jgi:hypothetical protein